MNWYRKFQEPSKMRMQQNYKGREGNKYSRVQMTKCQRKGFLWFQINTQQTKITKMMTQA